MIRRASLLPVLGLVLCLPLPGAAQVHRSAQHDFRIVTVADGLVQPWSMAFLPGGDMLVTERGGHLRIIRDGALLPEPVPGLPTVRAEGQGGLLDVVPHPDFAENHLLYFSYSKPSDDGSRGTTAVARGRFDGDRLSDVEDIFVADLWSPGRGHYGSRLAFDGNGYLFITLGDRQSPPAGDLEAHPAQDLSNHFGSTIRLHDDGRVPADNPFVGQEGARPEIWTYGHRNMQGLVVHPETGDVWVNEHGPQGGDELNLLQPGRNYGWPVVGHGVNYRTGLAIHEGTMREGMESPVNVWVPSIGISGMTIYTGDEFPGWRGNVFVGGMAGEMLVRLSMDGRQVTNVEQMLQRMGRIRDVRQGPDGYLYVAFESRDGSPTSIVRLEPTEEPSTPPGFANEFAGQFNGSARKLVALAEAMPAASYSWRPMEGVSSVAEVFMHIARYNYMYPHENLGIEPPAAAAGYAAWEETITAKELVVEMLAASMEHVRRVVAAMDAADMERSTSLYGRDVAQWAVLLQLVAHMNEHLGQSIAYARMNQVAPPWSR
ncbi:MAG TPA: DinB family protein [Longimicrobiales bacterium]|nr:DinB family protein [Longimicrobiales bacterium]